MTIRQYIRKYGWEIDCIPKACRAMNVDVGFINDENREDETELDIMAYDEAELDIMAYDEAELSNLFRDFCRENGFPQNTVTHIVVVQMADSMEELE